jgi:hypothetical protein
MVGFARRTALGPPAERNGTTKARDQQNASQLQQTGLSNDTKSGQTSIVSLTETVGQVPLVDRWVIFAFEPEQPPQFRRQLLKRPNLEFNCQTYGWPFI